MANAKTILANNYGPDEYYLGCDTAYNKGIFSTKEAYWKKMVEITIDVMSSMLNNKMTDLVKVLL